MTDQNPTAAWESPMNLDERSRPPRPGYSNLDGLRYRTGEIHDDYGITILIAEATPQTPQKFWLRLIHHGGDERPDLEYTYTHACHYMNGIGTGAYLEAAKHRHHPTADRDGITSTGGPGGHTTPPFGVLNQARSEARALGHNYIGTEHLLLAITLDPAIIDTLRALDANPVTVCERVRTIIGTGDGAPHEIPLTRRARTVLDDYAIDEAARLGHNHLDASHVFLGLLAEGQGTGAQVLNELGITLDRARQHHTHPRPAP